MHQATTSREAPKPQHKPTVLQPLDPNIKLKEAQSPAKRAHLALQTHNADPTPKPAQAAPPKTPQNLRVKRRSIPFDEDKDLDPWMLFPRLQRPHSALKNNSLAYRQQAEEAEEAHRQSLNIRGSPLTTQELKDLAHMNYGLGKYGSPPRWEAPMTPLQPASVSRRTYDPMEID